MSESAGARPGPDDERYRVPGTRLQNWTAYSRENIPKPPPRYAVDDEVVIVGTDRITHVYQDCDGTPLYATASHGNGFSDASLIPAAEGIWSDEIPHWDLVMALRAQGWTVEPPGAGTP